ncbi:unnamed protein product, partial [Rotaria sp. Silwood2]
TKKANPSQNRPLSHRCGAIENEQKSGDDANTFDS